MEEENKPVQKIEKEEMKNETETETIRSKNSSFGNTFNK